MISFDRHKEWNELQFLSWSEFLQMAPAIVLLEVRRIDRLLNLVDDLDHRNRLVKARFEMRQFVALLKQSSRESVRKTGAAHLRHAMLSLALEDKSLDQNIRLSCAVLLDRLNAILERIELIY